MKTEDVKQVNEPVLPTLGRGKGFCKQGTMCVAEANAFQIPISENGRVSNYCKKQIQQQINLLRHIITLH